MTSASGGFSETAWSGAGSGCSVYEPKPSWQHDTGCAQRTVADVAGVADPTTGVAAYDSTPSNNQSGWLVFGGTSVASPLVAATFALAAPPAAGSVPASLPYANPSALRDVTSGANGACGSYLCTAASGYDGPTGLGTPNGTAAFTALTPIAAKYAALGGSSSVLGTAVGAEYAVAHGSAQNYTGGRIYYSPATGAHEVHGAVLSHYLTLGGPASVLALPVTDETATPDGIGRYNHFSAGGSIYWTARTGAWSVHGAIRARWALGWERGPLGYPVTDESGTPDGVGRFNHFSAGGSIYWTPATSAHAVYGAIRVRWSQLGWERSPLGYPTTDEYTVTGSRRNDFQHGAITWTAATGATTVTYR